MSTLLATLPPWKKHDRYGPVYQRVETNAQIEQIEQIDLIR